jgi:general secretion pathway protein K
MRANPTTDHHRGAALITAMLLAALIALLSAAWLARFDTQLRAVEAQRAGTQARWLQRAATDWARMIVQEDSQTVDHLREVWAVPIAAVRMTDVAGAQEAFFSGNLQDAQSLFNINNLRGTPSAMLVSWAQALARHAGLSNEVAAAWVKQLQAQMLLTSNGTAMLADFFPSYFTPAQREALELVFAHLPAATTVNINTAPLAVLAAHPALGSTGAAAVLSYRETAYFKDEANMTSVLRINSSQIAGSLGVSTAFFIATGRMTVGRMDIMARSLIQRSGLTSKVIWTLAL